MIRIRTQKTAGFTVIELLVVIGMIGVFMAAVFSLYQTHQRSAFVQEETGEVQQNLRVALGRITHDISMAGFLIPGGTPIQTAGNNTGINGTDTITINTASATSVSARIILPTQDVNFLANDIINIPVSNLGGFDSTNDVNSAVVSIIGSQSKVQAVSNTFDVTAVQATGGLNCGAVLPPCLTLKAKNNGSGTITRGDMIVKNGGGPFPNIITFSIITGGACPVNQSCLGVNGLIIANNLANTAAALQFRYLMDDGTEVDAPVDLTQVQAVRVTLNGQTATTTAFTAGQPKNRVLVSVAGIRNR